MFFKVFVIVFLRTSELCEHKLFLLILEAKYFQSVNKIHDEKKNPLAHSVERCHVTDIPFLVSKYSLRKLLISSILKKAQGIEGPL